MKVTVSRTCIWCRKTYHIEVDSKDYKDWEDGKLIQKAMPYLSEGDRELLISKTCNSCFDEMFK